jgi:hypothetical protein
LEIERDTQDVGLSFLAVLGIRIRWICNSLADPDVDPYYLSKIERYFRKSSMFNSNRVFDNIGIVFRPLKCPGTGSESEYGQIHN